MSKFVIVGGGISGLIAATVLKNRGNDFVGFEKSGRLGGRSRHLLDRIHLSTIKDYCEQLFPGYPWEEHSQAAQQRTQKQWGQWQDDVSEHEDYFLQLPYYTPQPSLIEIIDDIEAKVRERFILNETVSRIDPNEKVIRCESGRTQQYEKILWCVNVAQLKSAWLGDKSGLSQVYERDDEDQSGAIVWSFVVPSAQLDFFQTTMLAVRHKSWKLHAIGSLSPVANQKGMTQIRWVVFLPEKIFVDKEEIAKAIRAVKREVFKEFSELKRLCKLESICYVDALSQATPMRVSRLELLPDVFVLGPEVQLESDSRDLSNLDLLLQNAAVIEASLAV